MKLQLIIRPLSLRVLFSNDKTRWSVPLTCCLHFGCFTVYFAPLCISCGRRQVFFRQQLWADESALLHSFFPCIYFPFSIKCFCCLFSPSLDSFIRNLAVILQQMKAFIPATRGKGGLNHLEKLRCMLLLVYFSENVLSTVLLGL